MGTVFDKMKVGTDLALRDLKTGQIVATIPVRLHTSTVMGCREDLAHLQSSYTSKLKDSRLDPDSLESLQSRLEALVSLLDTASKVSL